LLSFCSKILEIKETFFGFLKAFGKGVVLFFIITIVPKKDRNQPREGLISNQNQIPRTQHSLSLSRKKNKKNKERKKERKKMFGRWRPKAAKRSEEIRRQSLWCGDLDNGTIGV
jgi:hypothetical protein